ncbi:NAD(P)H-dependent glycerol-3-phosphate dehydrogenase [Streptomyces silvisoli]|uniref:Glycerol-3-phosphate dehydrogenase [NAD(P)+] n=1 Tax=Streptomyces silvisoli TaxID=3034235 RepID=A0ABT5ZS21_9ACTN|nr:NAD(P)H-dependent glycerol-3-phosphate dehydrogenase [Streptomyces silvisoli]MDF3292634.1 NAD(P)H-dependent glycerol-3-phosphate dehydrogenase [Streptomyces silvisoli]
MRTPRMTVVGAGSWGTTIASLAARNVPVLLWAREPGLAERITATHENPDYLAGHPLHPELKATASLAAAADQADVVVMAVPTHAFRQVLAELAPHVRPWVPVVSAAKGFEEGTNKRMSEVIAEELPGHPAGVLSGPNLAVEVLTGLAAAAVIAMPDLSVAQRLQGLMRTRLFRVYTATDVIGVEVGGAVKNVVAIAAGMADGLGTGDNTRAMVICRGVAEMTRLGVAMGGNPATCAGLTGLGDAIATSISPLSRNRSLGMQIARGKTVEEATHGSHMVTEGVRASRASHELAEKLGVDAPIIREINAVVNEGRTPQEAFRGLLHVKPATESEAG